MRRLADTYVLRGLDVRPAEGIATVRVADYDDLLPALAGVEVVVHLTAVVSPRSLWEDVLEHNIIGARNIFEAARVQGVDGSSLPVRISRRWATGTRNPTPPFSRAVHDRPVSRLFDPTRCSGRVASTTRAKASEKSSGGCTTTSTGCPSSAFASSR